MSIAWLQANSAYVIIFGDSIIDIDGQRFFGSIKEIGDLIRPKGLTVKNKQIMCIEEERTKK